jgi:predicted NBD/HSP70 family sugar kinase
MPNEKYFVGFDVGGSSIKAALVLDKKTIKTQLADLPDNLDGLLNLIEKIFKELTADFSQEKIGGVGFGVAGMLDKERKTMVKSPNISYLDNQPLQKLFLERMGGLPVKIENDARCFLIAEKKVGLAQNMKDVFFLTLGSGVGGAWMVDGQIFRGAHGTASEFGHMNAGIDRKEDFEEIASNKFLQKTLGVEARKAIEMVRVGDTAAVKAFEEMGRNLGIGIANIIDIFDPEAVILSGGVIQAKDFFVSAMKEEIIKFATLPSAKETKILFSELGRFAGALGAALMME